MTPETFFKLKFLFFILKILPVLHPLTTVKTYFVAAFFDFKDFYTQKYAKWHALCAQMPMCLTCPCALPAHVPYMSTRLTCPRALHAHGPYMPTCLKHAHVP